MWTTHGSEEESVGAALDRAFRIDGVGSGSRSALSVAGQRVRVGPAASRRVLGDERGRSSPGNGRGEEDEGVGAEALFRSRSAPLDYQRRATQREEMGGAGMEIHLDKLPLKRVESTDEAGVERFPP